MIIKGKEGKARMYDPTDELPEAYSASGVDTLRDRVGKPHSYNKLRTRRDRRRRGDDARAHVTSGVSPGSGPLRTEGAIRWANQECRARRGSPPRRRLHPITAGIGGFRNTHLRQLPGVHMVLGLTGAVAAATVDAMSPQGDQSLREPMAGFPGCTPGGSCRTIISVRRMEAISKRLSPTMIGTGATADQTGLPPVRFDRDLNAEPPGQADLYWSDCVFVQRTRFLGPIWMRLAAEPTSANLLRSVDPTQPEFFPATSRTSFHWRLELPRYGWTFENQAPMVTESVPPHLLTYPVETAAYRVTEKVLFRRVGASRVPGPGELGLTAEALVEFGPDNDAHSGAVEVSRLGAEEYSLAVTIGPYEAERPPRSLRVAWYIRDPDVDADHVRGRRGICSLRRGGEVRVRTAWSRPGAAPGGRSPTLVLLSLDPRFPGHAEYPVDLGD